MEDEERAKRLGYDKQREEEEARAVKEREAAERKASGASASRTTNTVTNGYKEEVAPTRLGFGQTVGQAAAPVVKT